MKLTLNGWVYTISSLIIFALVAFVIFFNSKRKKNNNIGKIIYTDNLSMIHIAFLILSAACMIMFAFLVVRQNYNTPNGSSTVMMLSCSFMFIFQVRKLIVSENGIGAQDLLGNVYMFTYWSNIKECKWINSDTIRIIWQNDKGLKKSIFIKACNKNKSQIMLLIEQHCVDNP